MDSQSKIEEILSQEQYKLTQEKKNRLLLPLLSERIRLNIEFSPLLKKFYSTLGKNIDDYYGGRVGGEAAASN